MKIFFQILFIFFTVCLKSQIPDSIIYKWNISENSLSELPKKIILSKTIGFDNSGKYDNSILLQSIIDKSYIDSQTVIILSEGIYKFSKTIFLKSNVSIEGKGADKTKLIFDNGGIGNLFEIRSTQKNNFIQLKSDLQARSENFICNSNVFENKAYYEILIDAENFATSDWAMQSIGQIIKVKSIENNYVFIYGDFKHDFKVKNNVRYRKIIPINNVNFRFFSIERKDKTSSQTNNFNFQYAANCEVKGVESINTNMSHITFSKSYNCLVRDCYIHHGLDYGGGGKAYGTELSNTSTSCRIENNIFENLRHSILLQSGANGNIIIGNYSKNPYWTEALLPSNSAGEIVLHGNYPFANLIEQNQVGNIVIDNSHGINGPNNLFFRNRATLWGVFMNEAAGDNTHFIANEIVGNLCNYSGKGNTILFNYRTKIDTASFNNIILPASFYSNTKPEWWQQMRQYPSIGIPKTNITENLTSYYRYNFDTLRALNTSDDVFILKYTINKKQNENSKFYFEYESDLQVNVNSINLEIYNKKTNRWQNITENFSNKFLFQKYKYSDSINIISGGCYRFNASGYNEKKQNSDSFCFAAKTTLVKENLEKKIKIYPNPFCEKIQIYSPVKSDLKVLDICGKTILSKSILPNTNTEITSENLKKGIYLFYFDSNGKIYSKTIIKN
ncbi:MAG: T9SS type A sorting domain-containing protein [Bacteroidia bacterium]|nr:T9SS type A sorting domain-containing protein [Bacteroidia bacterium]